MTDLKAIQNIVYTYILNLSSVLYFRLDAEGHILEANQYARQIADIPASDPNFEDVILDFSAHFSLGQKAIFTGHHLLSINTREGEPRSYLFSFEAVGEEILVFGHVDEEETDAMRKEMLLLNQELGNTSRQLHKKNAQLKNALDHVKTLQGIIPICSYCHKIRNDQQIWDRLETYLSEHTDARLSHGICPDCMDTHFPEYQNP